MFAAGEATTQLAVPTEDDDERQGTYTVTAQLVFPPTYGHPWSYWRDGSLSESVTVRDNELQSVHIPAGDRRVIEGETVTFSILRKGKEPTPLTVNLEIEAPTEYVTGTVPSSVTIPGGSERVEFEIQTVDDSVAEDKGELTVTVLDGTGYRPVYPETSTITIFDNDGGLPSVRVTKAEAWVDEGEDVVFTVTRSGVIQNPLDVRLSLYRLRYRVTAADLSDPTLGVTTPEKLIPFGQEEITLSFPAGTASLTVTRSTTDDSFNYGNSTYHAIILADADDDYDANYDYAASVWVQDDDRPTVTVSAPTTPFYGRPIQPYPGVALINPPTSLSVTLTRTGDASGRLPIENRTSYTTPQPAPVQDVTVEPSDRLPQYIPPGATSAAVHFSGLKGVNALGRTHRFFLADPHHCPDDPEACGYRPQYTLGTSTEATLRVYGNFMGVRIENKPGHGGRGGSCRLHAAPARW